MAKRKPKITLVIDGDKVTLTMEHGVPPTIAQSIPNLIATAIGQASTTPSPPTKGKYPLLDTDSWTVKEKIRYIVLRYCRHGWFTSRDVLELYNRTFHPSLVLATVSTYLARMHKDGSLSRRGSAAQREYRVNIEELSDEISSLLAIKIQG
ncbi:MAG: hypothetical protein ACFFCO_01405 [Promethearchaeota archaeon]